MDLGIGIGVPSGWYLETAWNLFDKCLVSLAFACCLVVVVSGRVVLGRVAS